MVNYSFINKATGIDKKQRKLRNRKIWKCRHCDETQYASANSGNKEVHLLERHSITKAGNKLPRARPLDQYTRTSVENAPSIRQPESYVQLTTAIMVTPFKEALIAFIVICQMALSLVTNDIFVEFLRIIYPSITQILPSSQNTIRDWVITAFEARRIKLKASLSRSESMIHFSFDLWTSPNHLALLGIVAHYIDEYGQNQSVSSNLLLVHFECFCSNLFTLQTLIAIRQLHGAHSGENQAEVIIQVITEFEIQARVGYFVTDNASNNDSAIEIVVAHFCPQLSVEQRHSRRLRCLGHVINLAAKAFLYGKEFEEFEKQNQDIRENSDLLRELQLWRKRGPVGKLHNVIIFICRSPQRREKFANTKAFADDEASAYDHLNLVVDNATRWNSLYSMIERSIKLRDRIDRFCIDYAESMHGMSTKKAQSDIEIAHLLKNDALTADDWQALAEVMAILEKFYMLTKRAEGTKLSSDRGVLSDYMTTLNELLNHTRMLRDDLNVRADNPGLSTPSIQHLQTCIVNCWTKLDEYFAIINETPSHYASVVTNPRMKWKYFEHSWKDAYSWKDAVGPESWLPGGKAALAKIWDEYKYLPVSAVAQSVAGSKRARSPDEFERATDMTLLYGDEEDEDQLEVWLSTKPFSLEGVETLPQYWLRQKKHPSTCCLAQMGLDMAAIPAMSSDCERVFSQGKLLITGQRNRLKPDIIEATQCLRMWLIMDRKGKNLWKGRGNWSTPAELFNNGE